MNTLKIDVSYLSKFIDDQAISSLDQGLKQARQALLDGSGKGNDFLGWITLPKDAQALQDDILDQAQRLKSKAKLLIVIGIGGSYLGARAVIEALQNPFIALDPKRDQPLVLYAGHQLSEDYLHDLLQVLDRTDYALCVISKSGTTTEPAIAFRILKKHLEDKYGQAEARQRVVAITDRERGALKTVATNEGYPTYVVPDDVGGRYSVLTPVGLLPIAVAGVDIKALLQGACDQQEWIASHDQWQDNPAMLYAALRHLLYKQGKTVEIMVNYDARLAYFTEWWKQLYGESEGKEGKGIFPAGVNNTSDLHSMGQYIQEGERLMFETVLWIKENQHPVEIPSDGQNLDGMNFVAGKTLGYVNEMAQLGTILAHIDGQVPNIRIEMPKLDAYHLGQLIYFYEFACGMCGYLLDINPFDQPGVEAYKKNMFKLLGK